jgi:UDP-N-acetylglucosamine:LPS N-acetylglucosamine transferase
MTQTRAANAGPGTRTDAPRVLVVSGSVGAGHDGAARELAARLTTAGAVVEVRDYLTAVPRPLAYVLGEGYLSTVERIPSAFEFLYTSLERKGLSWRVEAALLARGVDTIARWVDDLEPDVVVGIYPPAVQTIGRMRGSGRLPVPAMSYLTDPAAHVSWLHPALDLHATVTAATARQAAADYGVTCTVAGPLVPARFSVRPDAARLAALRAELELPDGVPVALLGGGSLGLGDVAPTARLLAESGATTVVLCARNEPLRRSLEPVPGVVPLGWRTDVHELLHVADVLVQNAGGLSLTEAMVAGLPAVSYRPLPGHGRANATVLDEAGLAPWARTPQQLAELVHAAVGRDRTPPRFPDPAELVLTLAASATHPERAA